ncbi:DUF1310 family protein [Alloscardovia theropitheci]|uniref:DUF1310 family protein n=1 Tax=Alloscardovia theropitheci TaxID=2496842 RepID=A0A4R0QTK4_9BIFI|nr:DUF1310 family protein [Alloscardovia theropitheci]
MKQDLKSVESNAFSQDAQIKSYKVLANTIEHNPMGGIMFTIELNDDSELQVDMILTKDGTDNNLQISLMGLSSKADDLYVHLGVFKDADTK